MILLWTPCSMSISLVLGGPKMNTALNAASSVLNRKESSPLTCCYGFPYHSPLGHWPSLPQENTAGSLAVPQSPMLFSANPLSKLSFPFFPGVRDYSSTDTRLGISPLSNFMKFLSTLKDSITLKGCIGTQTVSSSTSYIQNTFCQRWATACLDDWTSMACGCCQQLCIGWLYWEGS